MLVGTDEKSLEIPEQREQYVQQQQDLSGSTTTNNNNNMYVCMYVGMLD